ncbi:MAG: hypothetical protein ACOX1U_07665 [Saccharofermentanales bacterium]|jgi:hypothetical protein
MKTYYNLVIGCIIFAVTNSVMLLASLFLHLPADQGETWRLSITFLIAALPVFALTFFLARLMKTNSKKSALKQALQWLIVQLVLFILIALGQKKIANLLAAPGFYVVLAFVFIGPLLHFRSISDKKSD